MNSMKAAASIDGGAVGSAGAAGEHDQQRPQALAAAGNDVLGDLVHQGNGALEPRADDAVDGFQIAGTSARICSRVINSMIWERRTR